jgi:mono/diheme cytochrome c family protein
VSGVIARRRCAWIGVVFAVLLVGGLGAQAWDDARGRERGRAVFFGATGLPARLAGHAVPLPSLATRCVNCHQAIDAASPAAAGGRPFATPLDRARLAFPRSRHGGPPTAYDLASLCALLRTGVDAGHVVVSTVMPRYQVSDAGCGDVHAYLMSR